MIARDVDGSGADGAFQLHPLDSRFRLLIDFFLFHCLKYFKGLYPKSIVDLKERKILRRHDNYTAECMRHTEPLTHGQCRGVSKILRPYSSALVRQCYMPKACPYRCSGQAVLHAKGMSLQVLWSAKLHAKGMSLQVSRRLETACPVRRSGGGACGASFSCRRSRSCRSHSRIRIRSHSRSRSRRGA